MNLVEGLERRQPPQSMPRLAWRRIFRVQGGTVRQVNSRSHRSETAQLDAVPVSAAIFVRQAAGEAASALKLIVLPSIKQPYDQHRRWRTSQVAVKHARQHTKSASKNLEPCAGSIHAGLFRRPARLGRSSDYTPAWAPLVRAPDAAGRRCRSARTGPARRSGRACGKASRPGARPRTPWPRSRGRWRRARGRSAPGHREWRNDAARHHLQPMPAGGTAMLESMGRIGAACFLADETE